MMADIEPRVSSEMDKIFSKIISGGQTGVDRAALDVALELGIPCGGWCPKGRRAEDGPIEPRYPLKETSSPNYPLSTEKNLREADGTFVLTNLPLHGGPSLTVWLAIECKKPHLIVDLYNKLDPSVVWEWGEKNSIKVLNVTGPKESEVQGIYVKAVDFLRKVFNLND